MFDLIKLVALVLTIGYIIYYALTGVMRSLLGMPTLNALCLFSLILSFVFYIISIVIHNSNNPNKATEDTLSMIALVFMGLAVILGIYYLFR